MSFVREFKDYINWERVSYNEFLDDIDFMREFRKKIKWDVYSKVGKDQIYDDFIKEFADYVDWESIFDRLYFWYENKGDKKTVEKLLDKGKSVLTKDFVVRYREFIPKHILKKLGYHYANKWY